MFHLNLSKTMRNLTLLIMGIFMSFPFIVNSQTIVSTTPENKNVVLEEFTGIYCGYCPDGHRLAQELMDSKPDGDVFLINVHTGSYATPQGSDPDFQTSFGASIASQSSLAGYPAGTVNRHLFSGMSQNEDNPGTALSRFDFTTAANTILNQSSYVNVGVEATIDAETRELSVHVELYYTGDSPEATNKLNVALVQNNVVGPQSGSSANPTQVLPDGSYNHMHMLRHLLTGQWGADVSTTTTGTFVDETYTYTLPENINDVELDIGNLEVIAFVAESNQEIISAAGAHPTYINIANTNDAALLAVNTPASVCGAEVEPVVEIINNGSANLVSVEFEYSVNGGSTATHTWTGNLASFQRAEFALPAVTYTAQATNTLNITTTSINDGTDEDASDNSGSTTFAVATTTSANISLEIKPDDYGSETTWEITNSAGTVLHSGGPYTNGNTTVINESFNLSTADCYTFTIFDEYGDGMDSGYGVGYWKLYDNENLFAQGGEFAASDEAPFESDGTTGIISFNNNTPIIYPNPTTGNIFIENAENATVAIYDILGNQIIRTENNQTRFNYDLSKYAVGTYYVKVSKDNKTITKKLMLTK